MLYLIAGIVLAVVLGMGLLAAYQRRGAPKQQSPAEIERARKRYVIERRSRNGSVQHEWETDDSKEASAVIVQERDSGRRGAAYMDGKQIRRW